MIVSKAYEAWDRRWLVFSRTSNPHLEMEKSGPAFGFWAWVKETFTW